MEAINQINKSHLRAKLRLALKWVLFPGLNVGTRKRLKLSKFFRSGPLYTLDAGCGNGAFVYQACAIGNKVLGINIDREQVRRCNEFREFLKIEEERCRFKLLNIYDLLTLGQRFDQIICFEILEHLERDVEVLKLFRQVLKPGGLLHICTPRGKRKSYYGEVFSDTEDGGHVRLGYELSDLTAMLAAERFTVTRTTNAIGYFSIRVEEMLNWLELTALRDLPPGLRETIHVIAFFCAYPMTFLDLFSKTHLCVYVQATALEQR